MLYIGVKKVQSQYHLEVKSHSSVICNKFTLCNIIPFWLQQFYFINGGMTFGFWITSPYWLTIMDIYLTTLQSDRRSFTPLLLRVLRHICSVDSQWLVLDLTDSERKRKRSDSVLWQKPLHSQKKSKKQRDNIQTPPKPSITQQLRTDSWLTKRDCLWHSSLYPLLKWLICGFRGGCNLPSL